MNPKRPHVAVLCPLVWGIRNWVHSGLVAQLRDRGVRVTLIMQHSEQAKGVPAFEPVDRCEELREAPTVRNIPGKSFIDALLWASFSRRNKVTSYDIYYRWLNRSSPPSEKVRHAVVEQLAVVCSAPKILEWQTELKEALFRRMRDMTPARDHLTSLRPDLLVSTSCVVHPELPYIFSARDLGIPTLGAILSFDNLTSRGTIPPFDHYTVWNKRMRDQLLRFYPHRMPAPISVIGTPQFDYHAREEYHWPRERIVRELGLNAGDAYVLYGANHATLTPTEPQTFANIAAGFASNPALRHLRILLRLHPLDDYKRWSHLPDQFPQVVLSLPWAKDEASHFSLSSREDQERMVSTIKHAAICINMGSTMSLDAAALDIPVVCPTFAAVPGSAEDRFCKEAYETDHYLELAASGGLRLVHTVDELLHAAAAYVNDPTLDRDKRRAMVLQECTYLDGRNTDRLRDVVLGMLPPTANA